MNVCILVDDYLPDSIKVGAKMMHELAKEMQAQGHHVTVVTPSSTLKQKKDISIFDGVTVCRFKSGGIKNVGKIQRAFNETLLSYRAWRSLKNYLVSHHHDLIVYYSPTIFWGGLVARLKVLWSVPAYLILRDLFPQWAIDQGLIREGSMIAKYFRHFERKNYDAADTIGLMSQKNLEWFHAAIDLDNHLEVLYNWAADEPVNQTKDYKKQLGLEGKIVYFYGGNMGHAQDMMNIVRLANAMQKGIKAHFVLVGAGDEVVLVAEAIEKDNMDNITLLPSVSQEEFKQMLASFDVGLFTLHKEHQTHNFPGKLLGYMVQRLPILGSINEGNDLKEIVEDAKAGLVSVNGEDAVLFENAVKLLEDDYRKETGECAHKLLKDIFSVQAAARQILKTVMDEKKNGSY